MIEIVKDVPKGTKLWSPIFGECEFQGISCDNQSPIIFTHTIKEYVLGNNVHEFADFLCDGRLATCCSEDGECLLFPSKDNRNWETFKTSWKHKHFELGQKVLVPYYNGTIYKRRLTFYSHYDESFKRHLTTDSMTFLDEDIIAYKGNEDKLGKPVE